MTIGFFVPTWLEIPWGLPQKPKTFGMGARAAATLADHINQTKYSRIIVFGCAGALSRDVRSGQTFLVSAVTNGEETFDLQAGGTLSAISLFTSPKIVSAQSEKLKIHAQFGTPAVDMEMFHLWKALESEKRKNTIFVRGILDEFDDSLLSLSHLHRLPGRLWTYQREMKKFLKQIL